MVGWLEGAPLALTEPAGSALARGEDPGPLVDVAVDALAAVHRTDWRARLEGWSEPVDGAEEVDRWAAILARAGSDDPYAEHVAALLRRTAPATPSTGVLHGDFHLGNLLFARAGDRAWRVSGIVDWEISAIGPQALDLGWLALFTDPSLWAPPIGDRLWVRADRDRIVKRYRAAGGPAADDDLDWHQALACFRFAAIIAFNVGLHESGKREDPLWPDFAPSERALLQAAERLAGAAA
jgi:aminoglycoside phosphotransferase (APT) family kinase protein